MTFPSGYKPDAEEIERLKQQVFAHTPDYMAYRAPAVEQFIYILACQRLIRALK